MLNVVFSAEHATKGVLALASDSVGVRSLTGMSAPKTDGRRVFLETATWNGASEISFSVNLFFPPIQSYPPYFSDWQSAVPNETELYLGLL